MVIVNPLRIGLRDPFQMAIHGLSMGVTENPYFLMDDLGGKKNIFLGQTTTHIFVH